MKTLFNRITVGVCIVIFFSMIDSCIMAVLDSKYLFRTYAGLKKPVNGMLENPIDEDVLKPYTEAKDDVQKSKLLNQIIIYEPRHPFFTLKFLEVKGKMWRGILETDVSAPAGDYSIMVFPINNRPNSETVEFYKVWLFSDEESFRANLPSFSQRYLGFEPFWIIIALFPIAAGCIYLTMKQTEKEDALLQKNGIGPIYKLAKRKDNWEIIFGLGASHGVHTGDRLTILNKQRHPVGELTASQVESEFSHANLPVSQKIAPDYYVALHETKPLT